MAKRSTTKTAHLTKLAKADPKFKALVNKYGTPRGPKDCTGAKPRRCLHGDRLR